MDKIFKKLNEISKAVQRYDLRSPLIKKYPFVSFLSVFIGEMILNYFLIEQMKVNSFCC